MTTREEAPGDDGARRDSALIEAIVDGDLAALDALYRRHASLAYGLALRLTGDETLAQDAVQTAFMNIWSNRPGLDRGTDPVRLRLVQLVARASMDNVRRRPMRNGRGMQPTMAAPEAQPLPMHPQRI